MRFFTRRQTGALCLIAALILAAGVSAVARAKFIGAEQFDAVLGRWWYFGWIAILTFLFGLVAEIVGGRK